MANNRFLMYLHMLNPINFLNFPVTNGFLAPVYVYVTLLPPLDFNILTIYPDITTHVLYFLP